MLLITGVANLGDLLIVLDSNADNFIARPYDPQYLLSLVDMMLNSSVEKPDPEKIRTQFKIQHEDREYMITADRRKLLEFLLSSFEIAVSRAADLGQAQNSLDGLKSTLERRVAERTSGLDQFPILKHNWRHADCGMDPLPIVKLFDFLEKLSFGMRPVVKINIRQPFSLQCSEKRFEPRCPSNFLFGSCFEQNDDPRLLFGTLHSKIARLDQNESSGQLAGGGGCHIARYKASRTPSWLKDVLTAHPTTKREKRSIKTVRYNQPERLGRYVMSDTQT